MCVCASFSLMLQYVWHFIFEGAWWNKKSHHKGYALEIVCTVQLHVYLIKSNGAFISLSFSHSWSWGCAWLLCLWQVFCNRVLYVLVCVITSSLGLNLCWLWIYIPGSRRWCFCCIKLHIYSLFTKVTVAAHCCSSYKFSVCSFEVIRASAQQRTTTTLPFSHYRIAWHCHGATAAVAYETFCSAKCFCSKSQTKKNVGKRKRRKKSRRTNACIELGWRERGRKCEKRNPRPSIYAYSNKYKWTVYRAKMFVPFVARMLGIMYMCATLCVNMSMFMLAPIRPPLDLAYPPKIGAKLPEMCDSQREL